MIEFVHMPVLTSVERNGDDLLLRLDLDSINPEREGPGVRILKLRRCADIETAEPDLRNAIAKAVEYKEWEDGILFSVDYRWGEFDVACERWEEAESGPTEADLVVRGRYLAECLSLYVERYESEHQRHQRLVRTLRQEVEREKDRAKRKLDFYRETNPVTAEATEAQIKVYERVARIVEQNG